MVCNNIIRGAKEPRNLQNHRGVHRVYGDIETLSPKPSTIEKNDEKRCSSYSWSAVAHSSGKIIGKSVIVTILLAITVVIWIQAIVKNRSNPLREYQKLTGVF